MFRPNRPYAWILALLLLTGCAAAAPTAAPPQTAGAPPAPDSAATPVDRYVREGRMEGGIAVIATLAVPEYFAAIGQEAEGAELGAADSLLIELEFETHGGDLMQYDLLRQASLVSAGGERAGPTEWVSLSDDAHHRKGYLRFSRGPAPEPAPAAAEGALTLELRDLGGIPLRTFQWELPGAAGG